MNFQRLAIARLLTGCIVFTKHTQLHHLAQIRYEKKSVANEAVVIVYCTRKTLNPINSLRLTQSNEGTELNVVNFWKCRNITTRRSIFSSQLWEAILKFLQQVIKINSSSSPGKLYRRICARNRLLALTRNAFLASTLPIQGEFQFSSRTS